MQLTRDGAMLRIYRGDSPKLRKDSTVWMRIRDELRRAGADVVRQSPQRDGHLFSDAFYIRERRGRWCAADGMYAVRAIHTAWNAGEPIVLTLLGDGFRQLAVPIDPRGD